MSALTLASEVLLRHSGDFEQSHILFAGDLQGDLPAYSESAADRAHTQQLHHWQVLNHQVGDNARFSLVAQVDDIADSDTLTCCWPEDEPEAQFQLMNILSLLPMGTDTSAVGENRGGACSAEQMLVEYTLLNKVDSARRRGLYHGHLEKQPAFDAEEYWDEYQTENLIIRTLPGVFSRDGPDVSSQLLFSVLTPRTKGKVLDVGCSAGVLPVALASHSPRVRLTLHDVSAVAIKVGRATLAANDIEDDVIASDVFSDVTGRLDMIISNPPFHGGMQTSLDVVQTLIRGAVRHLNSGGELRIAASTFLPYPKVLDEMLGLREVIAQAGRFRVYHTAMTRQAKKA